MKNNLRTTEEDMLITPYLEMGEMPEFFNQLLSVGQTTQEKDILLIATLTTLSSAFPNLYMRYGHTGKVYYPNLQTFIMAGAASGKGIANLAEQLVEPIHEQQSLIIPGDSTYPAFYETLREQGGEGLLFETEGSVITDIWKSGCSTYNTALRKSAEHETLSKNRLTTGDTAIKNPKVSMLLTGTFEQFYRLVPSVENGYFSRLNMLVLKDQPAFDETVFMPGEQGEKVQQLVARLGQQLLKTRATMTQPTEFRLTQAQASIVGTLMKKEYGALLRQLGSGFHATIIRNGITLMRIAAILTALRNSNSVSVLSCSDADFQSAVIIATKLLHHAAEAYQQIGGTTQLAVPEQKNSFQKESFLAILPIEFTTGECVEQAKRLGISERSAKRWIGQWEETGILLKIAYGLYQKAA